MKRAIQMTLLYSLLLSACSPSQFIPTPTQTFTSTLEPTSTFVPTSTNTPTTIPTETLTPTETIIPTDTPTLTPTVQNREVIFEEDFKTDKMAWKGKKYIVGYGDGKLSFEYPPDKDPNKKYWLSETPPRRPVALNGDGIVEVTFDQLVRFSGILFINPNTGKGYDFIVSCGDDIENWRSNTPSLGLLQPSNREKPWDSLSDSNSISDPIRENNGKITFRFEFEADKISIYINDVFIASRSEKVFSGTKLMGITVGNGDKFNVTEIKILGPVSE
jgi:hypothetical protein